WHVEIDRHFADGSKCVRRFFHYGPLPPRAQSQNSETGFRKRSCPQFDGRQSSLSSPFAPSATPLMRCFRMADGLNTITGRGEMGTSWPVCGLRPMRWPFLRTTNEPKDESFTVSPRSRQSVISFNTSSTSVADSVRDSPTFW